MKSTNPITTARLLLEKDLYYFRASTLSALLGLDRVSTSHLLASMRSAGLVARVEGGKYMLLGLTPEHVLSNPLYIGSHLLSPAYISYWSALHYHGLTEQVPLTVCVASTKRKPPLEFEGIRYQFVFTRPNLFFGYRREQAGGLPVLVADEAKSILDSLHLPRHAGGVGEVAHALREGFRQKRVDAEALVEYALRFNIPGLSARLGFLLEHLGIDRPGLPAPAGPVLLDPSRPRAGRYFPRWKLYMNMPADGLNQKGIA